MAGVFQGIMTNSTSGQSDYLQKDGKPPLITKWNKKVQAALSFIDTTIWTNHTLHHKETDLAALISKATEKFDLKKVHLPQLRKNLDEHLRSKDFPARYTLKDSIIKILI